MKQIIQELDTYASQLIKYKAKQMVGRAGLTIDDRKDIEQEMALDLILRLPKYNPDLSKKRTFMNRVVEHKIASLYEARNAARRDWKRNAGSLNKSLSDGSNEHSEHIENITSRHGHESIDMEEKISFEIDFNRMMEKMPDDLKDLCERLKSDSISEISRDTGIPRSTIYEKIKEIKWIFLEYNMELYN